MNRTQLHRTRSSSTSLALGHVHVFARRERSVMQFASVTTRRLIAAAMGLMVSMPAMATNVEQETCSIPDGIVNNLQAKLAVVVKAPDANGGLFSPNLMWSAVVDRKGLLCSVIRSDPDAWPGSRSIAIAKASTANNFSNSQLALSTAMLYSFTQPANSGPANGGFPAGSLYGLNNSNPFNPMFQEQGSGLREVPGGIITFGGGVPLYSGGKVIGGLGVSGDTACADHAIAFRMRKLAGLDGTPGSDNITYLAVGELPHDFGHPHCHIGKDITP
ncbi:GlcG/HbpS family heme-binding protein [Bradyrhizobium sp. HKCCYLS1011]|uniref:GlcG/HbpS family heme-binding protein n=1 Tax=Bradyrhizobium sp. HKCCYLS1011 TaxID=3420733 RepID=UPI003EB92089